MIDVDMIDAVKVQFLKPIDPDTFIERGMKAWLTGIRWNELHSAYELFFDFGDFDKENDKYFRLDYYDDEGNAVTAKHVGEYEPKYSVLYILMCDAQDDRLFTLEIEQYLRQVK